MDKTTVMCSICLDEISDDVERSTAKLHCGHLFHLDCIGSAFNVKGAMQCPNCRKVENGRWLYASGSTRTSPEIHMVDWSLGEDYEPSYPDIPFNIHWCPFSGLAGVHSTFGALESSLPAYHNLHRHHNMFVEHGAASSMAHSYVANFRPIESASSITNEAIEDPNFSYHWNGGSNPRAFPVTYMHNRNGVHHSHLVPANSVPNSTDQSPVAPVTLRSTRGDFAAMTRSGSYMHPFLHGHRGRSHERSHAIHHHHQSTNPLGMPAAIIPSMVRFHGRRTPPPPPAPANSVSDHNGGFFIVPVGGSSLQNSQEVPANAVFNRNGGFFVVPPRGSSVQSSQETPAISDRNGGFVIVPPGGSAFQSSHETLANSFTDRTGGLVVPSRGSSAQSSHEADNLLPVISSDRDSGWSSFHSGAGSDSNRTGNSWNGHWS